MTKSETDLIADMRIALFNNGNYNHRHAPELNDEQLRAAARVMLEAMREWREWHSYLPMWEQAINTFAKENDL